MFKQVVAKIIEFMKTVEVEFAGKPGPEKRAALIKLVCGAVNLPFVPDWIENRIKPMVVGSIADSVFKWVNSVTNGHIEAFPVTPDTTEALAEAAQRELIATATGKAPAEAVVTKTAEAPNITDINAKFDALVRKKLVKA